MIYNTFIYFSWDQELQRVFFLFKSRKLAKRVQKVVDKMTLTPNTGADTAYKLGGNVGKNFFDHLLLI